MLSIEAIVVIVGWSVSMLVALFYVPAMAARKTMKKFGLVAVKNSKGEEIYAAVGPDGDPISVPVYREIDGKVQVSNEFAPLAYALPSIAALQTKAYLTSTIQGKAGKYKQIADKAALEGLPIEQASQAMALEAFARGQYGKALMAYLMPKIQETLARQVNASGGAGIAAGTAPLRGRGGEI
jgi:hypothetical protein